MECNLIIAKGVVLFTDGVVRDNHIKTKAIAYMINGEYKFDERMNN